MKTLGYLLVFAVGLGIGIGAICVYRGISASIHAEHVLQAAYLSIQLLEEHVRQNHGEWPNSWADLERLPARDWSMYSWPHDSARVQQFVRVNFAIDPDRLARQSIDEFDAVRPIGPYYPFHDTGRVAALIRAIGETRRTGD